MCHGAIDIQWSRSFLASNNSRVKIHAQKAARENITATEKVGREAYWEGWSGVKQKHDDKTLTYNIYVIKS